MKLSGKDFLGGEQVRGFAIEKGVKVKRSDYSRKKRRWLETYSGTGLVFILSLSRRGVHHCRVIKIKDSKFVGVAKGERGSNGKCVCEQPKLVFCQKYIKKGGDRAEKL